MDTTEDMTERMREDLNPLGPAKGVLLALLIGLVCWTVLLYGGWQAMRWLL